VIAVSTFAMYATKPLSGVYHLMPRRGGDYTLCGLRVSRIPSGEKTAGTLQVVEAVPPGKTICKHCERIKTQVG